MIGFLVAKGLLVNTKRIYNKWPAELVEIMCYLNILLFSVAKLYILETNRHPANILGYVSGGFTLSLYFLVLVYHVFTEVLFRSSLWKKLKHRRQERAYVILNDYPPVDSDQGGTPEPTAWQFCSSTTTKGRGLTSLCFNGGRI